MYIGIKSNKNLSSQLSLKTQLKHLMIMRECEFKKLFDWI